MAKKFSVEWWSGLRPEVAGKETELLVEEHLDRLNQGQGFAYHRMPDARAARGLIKAQPADYLYFRGRFSGFLEVKATRHAFRLERARLTQLPMLNKFGMAGAANYVLVHHYMQAQWRVVTSLTLETGVPSWDLSASPLYPSADEALNSTGIFTL